MNSNFGAGIKYFSMPDEDENGILLNLGYNYTGKNGFYVHPFFNINLMMTQESPWEIGMGVGKAF